MCCLLTFIIFICTANSAPFSEPQGSFVTLNMSGMALSVFLVVDTGHGWFPKQTAVVRRSNAYCALTPCVNTWSMSSMCWSAQASTSRRYDPTCRALMRRPCTSMQKVSKLAKHMFFPHGQMWCNYHKINLINGTLWTVSKCEEWQMIILF